MKESSTVRSILQEANQIRERGRTSCADLQNYLQYQLQKIENKGSTFLSCNLCSKFKIETTQEFARAFKTMSQLEKAQFYLMNVKNVQKLINSDLNKKIGEDTMELLPISEPVIKIKFEIKDDRIYKKLTEINADILVQQKIIKINQIKQQIDLHCYLLRKSRGKIPNCLVLQSMQPFTTSDTIRLSFNSIDYVDSLNIIYRVWEESQYDRVKKILMSDNRFPRRAEGTKPQTLRSGFDFQSQSDPITTKLSDKKSEVYTSSKLKDSINQNEKSNTINRSAHLNKIERKLVTPQLTKSLNSFNNFIQRSFGFYVEKEGHRVRKIFQFDQKDLSIERICSAIDEPKHMRRRKPVIQDIKHLNSIPSQRTNLYREMDSIEGREYQFLYFRHYFTRSEGAYYIQKSIWLEQFKDKPEGLVCGIINYCIWRIRKIEQKIQIVAEADIKYSHKIQSPETVTSSYIGQFATYLKKLTEEEKKQSLNNSASIRSDEFQNEYISQISNTQEEFFTVVGSLNSTFQPAQINQAEGNDVNLQEMSMKRKQDEAYIVDQKLGQEITSRQTTQQTQSNEFYLKNTYQMKPKPKGEPVLMKQPMGHLLFGGEWTIRSSGELVNMNKQKIKMQSSVLKLVLQRMGKNLLSGKSIMNMSLPIEIFGIDSNLERIARGYIYAPLLLERAAALDDPVDRIKQVFCFGLGFSTSYIKMEKPFNPVLGQTYQALIDGCPVYAQQISHHPPISSMLFIGRGYRVHGNFEAKVQLGINSASGINEGFNYIQFLNDGSRIRFNTPPGQMQGIILGDRRLTLVKKSYYLDERNRIMCCISWGKNQKSQRKDSFRNDFFCGSIVKIKEGVNMSDYKNCKPKDVERTYGELHGRFTGRVYFEEQLLFDLNADAPYLLEDYSPCLQSDSRLRKDIVERKKTNFQQAQDAKEQIEEIQRADQKLRKKHRHTS